MVPSAPSASSSAPSPATRLLDSAATLFARHGYAAVTTRAIAAAASVNLATLHYYFGSKRALYLELLRRMYEEEHAIARRLATSLERPLTTDPAALRAFLQRLSDELVDIELRYPARAPLHMWRWLARDDDLLETEAELVRPLYDLMHSILLQAQQTGVVTKPIDLASFLRSYAWLTYGYFIIGPINLQTWSAEPRDALQVEAFKTYLHQYSIRMLGLDDQAENLIP